MKIENCGIILTTKCSKCKKIDMCGAFRNNKSGKDVYFCQNCIDKLERK